MTPQQAEAVGVGPGHGHDERRRTELADLVGGELGEGSGEVTQRGPQHGPVEVRLGVEEPVEDQAGHAGLGGDVVHRRAVVAAAQEGARGGLDDLGATRLRGSLCVLAIDLMYTRVFTSRRLPGGRRALVTGGDCGPGERKTGALSAS